MPVWFQGSTTEAIETSRRRKCLFVLVIAGYDEPSRKLLDVLDDPEASQLLVGCTCVSLKSYTNESRHFCQLYDVTIIPAIILIGLRGSPLEVVRGAASKAEIVSKIKKALAALEREDTPQYMKQKQVHLIPSRLHYPIDPLFSPEVPTTKPAQTLNGDHVVPFHKEKTRNGDAKKKLVNEPKERRQQVAQLNCQESRKPVNEPVIQAHFKQTLSSQPGLLLMSSNNSQRSEMSVQKEPIMQDNCQQPKPSLQEMVVDEDPSEPSSLQVDEQPSLTSANTNKESPSTQVQPITFSANNKQPLVAQEEQLMTIMQANNKQPIITAHQEQVMASMPAAKNKDSSLISTQQEQAETMPVNNTHQSPQQQPQPPLQNELPGQQPPSLQQQTVMQSPHKGQQHSQKEMPEPIQHHQIHYKQPRKGPPVPAPVTANIVIRKPDGSTVKKQFPPTTKLSDIKSFVDTEFRPHFSPYTLVKTTEPIMEFKDLHMSKTLNELDLVSAGFLLIMPSRLRDWKPNITSNAGMRAGGWGIIQRSILPLWKRVWRCVKGYVVRPKRHRQLTPSTSGRNVKGILRGVFMKSR